ncbi:MAG: alpha amylase C-terminal domain-containing protein [Vicinamibacterales bacterium]
MQRQTAARIETYPWSDSAWMRDRSRFALGSAVRIYQLRPESWRRVPEDANRPLSWRELAEYLGTYASRTGFTHVQLPIPAPASPAAAASGASAVITEGLELFVDSLHQREVGVIAEWQALSTSGAAAGAEAPIDWCRRYHIDGICLVPPLVSADTAATNAVNALLDVFRARWPDVLTIAGAPGTGLHCGFELRTDWARRLLNYMALDPILRSQRQRVLVDEITTGRSPRAILPLTPALHAAASLIDPMPGDAWHQFANARALFGYAAGLPGDVLWYMGTEMGQSRALLADDSLDWHRQDEPLNAGLRRWVADLNAFARESACGGSPVTASFEWVDTADAAQSVVSFLRMSPEGSAALFVCNFTPVLRHNYRVGAPLAGTWRERLNSDAGLYGGGGRGNLGGAIATPVAWHGRPYSINLTLPPLAVLVLCHDGASRGVR